MIGDLQDFSVWPGHQPVERANAVAEAFVEGAILAAQDFAQNWAWLRPRRG